MLSFVKFITRSSKFVNTNVHSDCWIVPINRRLSQKTCSNFAVARVLKQLKTTNSFGYNEYNESRNYVQNRIFFYASGILLSLFEWGEKEEEKIPELIMAIKRSIYLIQKEEFAKAEQMLHIALRQAQTLQHYNGITYVYDVMANLAFQVGDYKKAEVLFVSVMQRLIAADTPKDDIKIVHISLKMAKLFEETGDMSKAEEGYRFCLETLEASMKKDPENEDLIMLWAMSLDWYARMFLRQSKYSEALKYMEQAYHLSLRVHGREHEQTVILLNDLGTISCLTGEHDRAITYLTSAAEIGEKLTDMIDMGSIHVNLGSVYLKKGLYDEAKRSCEEGLKMARSRNDKECIVEAKDCLHTIKEFMNS